MGSGFCAGLSGWCRAKYRGHMHFGIGVKLFLVLYLLFLLVIGLMSVFDGSESPSVELRPEVSIVSYGPRVIYYSGLISESRAEAILGSALEKFAIGNVTDVVIADDEDLSDRICLISHLPRENREPPFISKLGTEEGVPPGESRSESLDGYLKESEGWLVMVVIFLSEVPGNGIIFPATNTLVKPVAGDAILVHNYTPEMKHERGVTYRWDETTRGIYYTCTYFIHKTSVNCQ